MRAKLLIGYLFLVLVGVNLLAGVNVVLSGRGRDVLLELRPVDPRAFLLGDYMELDYRLNPDIRHALYSSGTPIASGQGTAVIRPDAAGVARFVRLDDGSPLGQDEMPLHYRVRRYQVLAGPGVFFFQEGHAAAYDEAHYGILRLRVDGRGMLVGLADRDGRPIVPLPDTNGR